MAIVYSNDDVADLVGAGKLPQLFACRAIERDHPFLPADIGPSADYDRAVSRDQQCLKVCPALLKVPNQLKSIAPLQLSIT